MANSSAHHIQFSICGVHIDNGTAYRNGTVIIFRIIYIYNTLSFQIYLDRLAGAAFEDHLGMYAKHLPKTTPRSIPALPIL